MCLFIDRGRLIQWVKNGKRENWKIKVERIKWKGYKRKSINLSLTQTWASFVRSFRIFEYQRIHADWEIKQKILLGINSWIWFKGFNPFYKDKIYWLATFLHSYLQVLNEI